MTPKIKDGDYVFESNGAIVEISSTQEILQRAFFRLKAHYGEFELDKTLGSELHKFDLKTVSTERLFSHITEVLMPIEEIEVIDVKKSIDENSDMVKLTLYLKVSNEDATLEI